MKKVSLCADDYPKVFEVVFDSGFLPNDTWRICRHCNFKPEFSYYRISEKIINSENKS